MKEYRFIADTINAEVILVDYLRAMKYEYTEVEKGWGNCNHIYIETSEEDIEQIVDDLRTDEDLLLIYDKKNRTYKVKLK